MALLQPDTAKRDPTGCESASNGNPRPQQRKLLYSNLLLHSLGGQCCKPIETPPKARFFFGFIYLSVEPWGSKFNADSQPVTVELARVQLKAAGSPHHVEEVVGDKGYHKAETVQTLEEVQQVRSYIAAPKQNHRRKWHDKEPGQQEAV
jgi:hypothetical protein